MEEMIKLQSCFEAIKDRISFVPEVALVLGSGLGDYGDNIEVAATLNYEEIPNFPKSTVEGHKGRFVFGYVNGRRVVIMQGRVHYYEGYTMQEVVLPIRLMKLMGAEAILLTNAAGGVNYDYQEGNLMLISDHISSFVPSPLIGPNLKELGTRFPDMSDIYDRNIRQQIKAISQELGIDLKEGVYLQFTGPNFESPAEIRMIRTLGADAVGMSTACEAMVAKHMGMKVAGISCISNMACGMTDSPLLHVDVQEVADRIAETFTKLVTRTVEVLAKEVEEGEASI